MKKLSIAYAPFGILLTSLAYAEFSEDQPLFALSNVTSEAAEFALPTVEVSATKIETDQQSLSRSSAVVSPSEPQHRAAGSTAELVKHASNVSSSGGPRSSHQSLSIRGLSGAKVLQTVDGVPVRFQSGHRASYFLDPSLIKDVQVLKGPASSIWGSGAIGGVVAQQTIDASDLLTGYGQASDSDSGTGKNTAGYGSLSNNSNNDGTNFSAGIAARSGQFDWLLAGYSRDQDDIELGNGETLEGSGEESLGFLVKQDWFIDGQKTLGLSYRNEKTEGHIPNNASAPINGTSVFLVDLEQTTQSAVVDYSWASLDEQNVLDTKLYWDDISIEEQRLSDGRQDQTEQNGVGLDVSHVMTQGQLQWLLGMEVHEQNYDGQRSGTNRPTPPDAVSNTQAVYTQLNFPLISDLRAELGLRFDDFETEAKNLNSQNSDSDLTVSSALVWDAAETLNLTLRRDEAFRAPSVEELYSSGTHFCMGPGFCNTFLPNPDLKSEKSTNIEVIGKWQQQNLLGNDALRITAAAFQNDVKDFIEQIVDAPSFGPGMPNPGNSYFVNVSNAELNGFELELEYQYESLTSSLSYGQVRGRDADTGEDLTGISADTVSVLVQAELTNTFSLGSRVSHTQDQDKTRYAQNTNATVYDDYTTVDVFASWNPEALSDLRFDLNVNNLADQYYRQAWSELYETGREVVVAANYQF